ncbi:hypothetical protein JIN85_18170 [Luteolibacter pohnpeiensis]|uniref:Quinol:cytochrome C oxidoreductase n=1 Tax=Luteolibacter pohnpeiensis TaxID=454153 RepID=A0A934S773_9BACT|nr:hypothetical protein [Luteolibacter pohnpeiensis]MBK1884350.1 hypothetical protein [Luteolibacter pohnpeiensis]
MSHHVTSADIAIHGDHLDQSKIAKVKSIAGKIAVVGTVISLILLFAAPEKVKGCYAYSWVFAFYFFLTLSIGGVFWTLLHNVSNSGWGTSVRRIFENLGSTYIPMVLFGIPLLCPPVQHYLYEWMNIHREASGNVHEWLGAHHHTLLFNKYWYMNLPFWYGRALFYMVGLSLVIFSLRKLSTDQDTDPNPGVKRLLKARFHSTYTLIIFALTITFTGFDFVMGLDYKWFSTMWGVYLFAGSALNSMAVIILIATWLKSQGHLKNVVNGEHFHIMGKLLFAFTVFWAYITFSQFFLIWYANMTEETSYFLTRNTGGWNAAMLTLVFCHFVVPFVVLLQAWLKKNPKFLSWVAAYTLVMHVLDHYIITIPERGVSLGNIDPGTFGEIQVSIPHAFWGDIFAFITIGSAFLFFLLRALGQHSLYPNRDPRILESANMSN